METVGAKTWSGFPSSPNGKKEIKTTLDGGSSSSLGVSPSTSMNDIILSAKQSPNVTPREAEFQSIFHLTAEKMLFDYGCAIHKDKGVIAQGRMYITENFICFHSSLFGTITRSIQFSDVRGMVKKNTAYVFPNAIEIVLDNEKIFFGSFILRDQAYNALFNLWSLQSPGTAIPHRKNSLSLEDAPSLLQEEKRKKADTSPENSDVSIEKFNIYKSDSNIIPLVSPAISEEIAKIEPKLTQPEQEKKDKVNEIVPKEEIIVPVGKQEQIVEEQLTPPNQEEKSCSGNPKHFWEEINENDLLMKETFELSVGNGQKDADIFDFWKKYFMTNDFFLGLLRFNGFEEISMTEWAMDHHKCCLNRTVNFVSPLNTKIGPKKTRVVQSYHLKIVKSNMMCLESAASSLDVPYADAFMVGSRLTFLARPSPNPNLLIVDLKCYSHIKWNKSVWGIKTLIERSAIEGQKGYFAKVIQAIRNSDSAKPLPRLSESIEKSESSKTAEKPSNAVQEPQLQPPTSPIPAISKFLPSLSRSTSLATSKEIHENIVNSAENPGKRWKAYFVPIMMVIFVFLTSYLLIRNINMEARIGDLNLKMTQLEQKNKAVTHVLWHLSKKSASTNDEYQELRSVLGLLDLEETRKELQTMIAYLDASRHLFKDVNPPDIAEVLATQIPIEPSLFWNWILPSIAILSVGTSWILLGAMYFSKIQS